MKIFECGIKLSPRIRQIHDILSDLINCVLLEFIDQINKL